MLQNFNNYKVLQVFFDSPRKRFHMREISRKIRLAQPSVINHLKTLEKQGLVLKEKDSLYPTFRANRDNESFKILKQQNAVLRIHQSGLIRYLEEKFKPNCIILFGSASRGEDTETSDIDLFVQAEESEISAEKFEKLLKRRIAFIFEGSLDNLTGELKNSLINGQLLYGYLKVF